MKEKHNYSLQPQICTLCRIHDRCRQSCFKEANVNNRVAAYPNTLKVLEEEQNIIKFLSLYTWSLEMDIFWKNFLHTSLLDEEAESISEDENAILSSFLGSYCQKFHHLYHEKCSSEMQTTMR